MTTKGQAFKTIVGAILLPPILSLPRPGLPHSVDTEACDEQLGAAKLQTQPHEERKPLGFWSWTLLPTEKTYSVSEKKYLDVVQAIQTQRPYLQAKHFTVHSGKAWLR